MNVAAMVGLYSRRASVIGWQHAVPALAGAIDPLTQGPKASFGALGADRSAKGPFGETYGDEVSIRAYTTGKISSTTLAQYGVIEAGDMEICTIVPFVTDPAAGIVALSSDLLAAYNAGEFATIAKSATAPAFDRFRIFGRLWVAKSVPTPIADENVVVAWRTLVTKQTNIDPTPPPGP